MFNYTFYSMDYSVEHCVFYAPAEEDINIDFNGLTKYITITDSSSFYYLSPRQRSFSLKSPVLIRYSTDNSFENHKINMHAHISNTKQLKSDRINFEGKPRHSTTSKWSEYGVGTILLPIIGSVVPLILLYSWFYGFQQIMRKGGRAKTQS